MKSAAFFLFSAGLILSLNAAQAQKPVGSDELETVFSWMSGRFSSEKQAAADSAFFSITLKMRPVWKETRTEKWLYVEQAMAGKPPYRQRMYRLRLTGDTALESTVFELPGPSRFAGAAEKPEMLSGLTADSLLLRPGCAIVLRPKGDRLFSGSTPGRQCLSSLRGASYATSEVEVGPAGLLSWDRGWDVSGRQVWGAVKGGYRFDKLGGW